ncbi:MAG: hypothetical protein K2O67_02015 [Clostridia bacterium]|nr:hypothetical protein [Clostridia bacterium]
MNKNEKVAVNPVIKDDILRYKKNKFAGNFALLALVFNCLYFMLLYCIHESEMKTVLIGTSVIVNLLVLLTGFFCSEGIKGYNKKFSIVLFILAGVQIARIFIYPTMGMAGGWLRSEHVFGITVKNPDTSVALNGTLMIAFLAASAACFIVSGVFGLIIAQRLENFTKKVEAGEISVEDTLAKLDAEDAQAKSTQIAEVTEAEVSTATKEPSVSSEEVDNG